MLQINSLHITHATRLKDSYFLLKFPCSMLICLICNLLLKVDMAKDTGSKNATEMMLDYNESKLTCLLLLEPINIILKRISHYLQVEIVGRHRKEKPLLHYIPFLKERVRKRANDRGTAKWERTKMTNANFSLNLTRRMLVKGVIW